MYVENRRTRTDRECGGVWRMCSFEEVSIQESRKFVPRISEEVELRSRPRCTRGDSGERYERGEGG